MRIRKRCKRRADDRRDQLFWTTDQGRFEVIKTRVSVTTLRNYRTNRDRKVITHTSDLKLTELGKMYNLSCMLTGDTPLPNIFRWSFTNVLKQS